MQPLKVGLRTLREKPLIAGGLVLLVVLVSLLVYRKADDYGVNMWLFMGLYLSSLIPFYYGIGLMNTDGTFVYIWAPLSFAGGTW